MDGLQGAGELGTNIRNAVGWQLSIAHRQVVKVEGRIGPVYGPAEMIARIRRDRSRNILQNHQRRLIRPGCTMQNDNVRMPQAIQNRRLALEPLEEASVGGAVWKECLDCKPAAADAAVARKVNHSHSAATKF